MILSVKELKTYFRTDQGIAKAVDGVSFEIKKGKTLALVGESGCGKSITALTVMRLLQGMPCYVAGGEIVFDGQNILSLPEHKMRQVRGNRISMIFQEPMSSLNPVMMIGSQITEAILLHKQCTKQESEEIALDMLSTVKIPDPKGRFSEYPHQLSGGMKQRVMIAIALACEPELLIADEPTTALDVTVQSQILRLIKELQEKRGTSILLITHDMGVVSEMSDHIAVMYAGKIVEEADKNSFFKHPSHPYTTKLFESLPSRNKRNKKLSVIPGRVPSPMEYIEGCRFSGRCHLAFDRCLNVTPTRQMVNKEHFISCHIKKPPSIKLTEINTEKESEVTPSPKKNLVQVNNLKLYYPINKGLFKRLVGYVKAVDGLNLSIGKGETVALVGESGCGKTSAGKAIVRLLNITGGSVLFDGIDLSKLRSGKMRKMRRDIQIMFQDPYGSLNPRMMVKQIIAEGLTTLGSKPETDNTVGSLMERVGLNPQMMHRYPNEFSGGQRQRIGIARFLAVKPKFVVCDEVTSALDVSVQAQVLNLLKSLQDEKDLSYLFITHNLSVVSYIAERVAIMYLGRIVEMGSVAELFDNPKHPYTKALLEASPVIGNRQTPKIYLEGEVPSPINPPKGCHFHPRCAKAMPECRESYPNSYSFSKTHSVQCWLYT